MPTDFFGYKREVQPNGTLVSSELATIAVGGGSNISVVQNVTANYAQQVNPKFESGSPTLYWLTGQAMGSISFSRLVSSSGFLAELSSLKNSCGSVIPVVLGLDGTGGCSASAGKSGGGKVRFSGGVPESITISWTAGTLEVSEGASIKVATLEAA